VGFDKIDAVCGQTNGSASALVSGGSINANYIYIWSNNQTDANISNLAPGNYSVTVTNTLNGCTASGIVNIGTQGGPTATASVTHKTCNTQGSIMLNVSGGTGNKTFAWFDNATTQNRTNLNGGTYTVTITDAANCSFILTTTINDNTIQSVQVNTTPASTASATDGAATAVVTGGTTPLNYAWSNGQSGQNLSSISNLAAGFYFVTVSDVGGCNFTQTFNIGILTAINELSLPTVSIVPNPADRFIKFHFDNTQHLSEVKIDITDATGRVVYSNTLSGSDVIYTVDVNALQSAIYFVIVRMGDKHRSIRFLKN
jgi:hypothetical protein